MHMLRTCVSTRSCILLVNLTCNDMAHSTASIGQYVRNSARTRHTVTHRSCAFRGPRPPTSWTFCTLAKCCTVCSLRAAHSAKAWSQCTCVASNSSRCDAVKRRNWSTPYVACSLVGRANKRPWSNNTAHSSSPLGSIVACPSLMPTSNTSVIARALAARKGGDVAHFCPPPSNCTPCHSPVAVCSLNCN